MKTILIPMIYSCYNNCVDRPYRRGISTRYCGFGPLMDVDKLIYADTASQELHSFGPLMDVDKLIPRVVELLLRVGFGPLMDVDKLILRRDEGREVGGFGPLMDVDKLIQYSSVPKPSQVLGL